MKIHSVTLANVKGVASRTVEFPDSGVVIVDGPNEVGKSTVIEALDLLLDPKKKSTSRSKDIQAMQPVGQDLGPYVEAEVTIGGRRLRIAKQWLRSTKIVVEVLSPTKQSFTGDNAQRELERLIDRDLDRTLFESLRFAQGGGAATNALSESSVLQSALDQAAGADMHVAGGDDLLSDVEREYLRYFTPAAGRPSGELKQALTSANDSHDKAVFAHGSWQESLTLMGQRDAAVQQWHAAKDGLPELQEALSAARVSTKAAREAEQLRRQARERIDLAEAELRRCKSAVVQREKLRAEVQARQDAVVVVDSDAEALTRQRRELGDAVDEAKHMLGRATTEAETATQTLADLHDEYAQAQDLERLAQLREACARIGDLTKAHDAAQRAADSAAVTPAMADEIAGASAKVVAAQAAVEAIATLVSVERIGEGAEITIDGQATAMAPGGFPEDVLVTAETEISVAGVARVRVRPGGDAATLRADLEAKSAKLSHLLSVAGASSVDDAQRAGSEYRESHGTLRVADAELKTALSGKSAQAWTDQLAELDDRLGSPDEVKPRETDGLRKVIAEAKETLADRKRSHSDASKMHELVGGRLAAVVSKLERSGERRQTAKRELDRVTAALREVCTESPDEALNEAVAVAEANVESARAALAEIATDQAEQDLVAAERALAQAEQALAAQQKSVSAAQTLADQLNGRVEQAASEGRRENYDLAVQAFRQAKGHLVAVDRRARAAKQLHLTLTGCRDEAHDQYVEPYAAALRALGRRMHGESFDVAVDKDLVITHRELDGVSVPFESLSGGAQEQLGLLSRLAVASLVDADEGAPVIVDDALGYSDPDRLAQMGRVLSDPSSAGQVIVLTCSPERYVSIENAHRVHLAS